jgi:hypothetical protein
MRPPVWVGIAMMVGLSLAGSAGAQQPNGQTTKDRIPGKGDSVRVKGCLAGPTLQSIEISMTDETGEMASAFTYQLKGDKKLVKQLRDEHDGKVVTVIGILKSDLPQDSAIRGKTVGKTKVTFGVGASSTQRGGVDSATALPVLEVKSYEGSGASCVR